MQGDDRVPNEIYHNSKRKLQGLEDSKGAEISSQREVGNQEGQEQPHTASVRVQNEHDELGRVGMTREQFDTFAEPQHQPDIDHVKTHRQEEVNYDQQVRHEQQIEHVVGRREEEVHLQQQQQPEHHPPELIEHVEAHRQEEVHLQQQQQPEHHPPELIEHVEAHRQE